MGRIEGMVTEGRRWIGMGGDRGQKVDRNGW